MSMIVGGFSCKTVSKQDYDGYDTLRVASSVKDPDLIDKYYLFSDIAIPNYLEFEDSLNVDLDSDGDKDVLVLFSPKTLVDPDYFGMEGDMAHRIVVEIISDSGDSRIRNQYSNLVSNIGGVLSKYSGMELTNKGFKITHESGSRYSWTYKTFFDINESISLNKISKVCALGEESQEVNFEYENGLSLDSFNMVDTLNVDCNCEKIWAGLNSDGY